jgi:hypothetical protein
VLTLLAQEMHALRVAWPFFNWKRYTTLLCLSFPRSHLCGIIFQFI